MAELSRFYGIIVRMFAERGQRHHRPHLHAIYQGQQVVLAVDTIEILARQLPRRQQRLLEAWAELHQDELMTAWRALQADQSPERIDPLK